MKLSISTNYFRGLTENTAQSVKLFAGTGFKLLDLNLFREELPGTIWMADGDEWRRMTDEIGKAAASIGVKFSQAHAPDGGRIFSHPEPDKLMRCLKRSIKVCSILGIPNLVIHACADEKFSQQEFLRRNKYDFFARLFDDMERHNVNILVENGAEINSSYYYLRTGTELFEFINEIGHPLLHACWDTGHANLSDMDQYSNIMALGSHLRGLHIADNYGNADTHTAPFCGTCNFDPVMQALLDMGYKGDFTFESCNMLRNHNEWPHPRKKWEYKGRPVTKLLDVPLHLKQQSAILLYEIGKHILQAYDCFEEA